MIGDSVLFERETDLNRPPGYNFFPSHHRVTYKKNFYKIRFEHHQEIPCDGIMPNVWYLIIIIPILTNSLFVFV